MARSSKLYSKAHILLILLICLTLGAAVIIMNAPQKAGTSAARQSYITCSNAATKFISCNLAAPVPNGNTLIAVIGTRSTTDYAVDSISQTGATWNRAVQATNTSGNTTEIWYTTNIISGSQNGTAITINLKDSINASAIITQYSGILTTGALDKTANATGSSTTASTGTTTTTSQSNEVWVGGMTVSGTGTFGAPTSSFTKITESASTGGLAATRNNSAFFEKIVTSTATANTTSTITSADWSGAIATFNATGAPTQIGFSTTAPSLTAGICSGAITLETRDSSGAAVYATNGVQIQIYVASGDTPNFYTTSACNGSTVTSFTFNGTESSKTFYMKSTKSGSYQITATKISGTDTLTDGTLNYTVSPSSMSKLGIQMPGQTSTFTNGVAGGSPSAQTAGTSFVITQIRALDAYDNTVTSYSGSKSLSYSGAGTSPNNNTPSYTTTVSFTSGVSTTTLTTILYKAEASISLTVTSGGYYGSATPTFNVNAAALLNYEVVTSGNMTAGSCSTSGNSITALDQYKNIRTSDSSIVNMTTSGTSVTFYTTSACTTSTTQYTLSSGVANFYYKSTKKQGMSIGASWTGSTMPSTNQWRRTTYGNGKFVSMGVASGVSAYSTDGITWSSANMPTSAAWYSVTYGGGRFVAVASGSTNAAYSSDGITWYSGTLPASQSWQYVAYGNGKFVAVAANSSTAAYSTDGATWYSSTLPNSNYWYRVAFGNGRFVAIATNSSSVSAYSTDGITWSTGNMNTASNWNTLAFGGGKFLAINSTTVAQSTDGASWTVIGSTPGIISDIIYGNGKFMTVNSGSTSVYYSFNGSNWSTGPSTVNTAENIAYGNGRFVGISGGYANTANYLTDVSTVTITATKNADVITGSSDGVVVYPDQASTLIIALPGQTFVDGTGISGSVNFTGLRTPNATAGTSFSTTIYAIDSYNNLADYGSTNYTGSKTISWANSTAGNSPGGTAPSFPTTSVTFSNGVSTTTLTATYYNATTSRTVRADDTGTPLTGTASTGFTVQPQVVNNYGVSASTPQISGVAFNVTVTARDTYNNALGSLYTAPSGVYTWSSTAASSPDSTAPSIGTLAQANFTSGVATKSVTLYKAESVTFTASEPSPSTITGTSSSITINPGSISANNLDSTVTGNSTGYSYYNQTVTITLKDTWRNPISGVDNAYIVVSSTGSPTIVQPASNTNASGVTTATVTWPTPGSYTVSVTINTAPLVQNDGITADLDGKLDQTLAITISDLVLPSSRLQGGTRITGGTTIR